MKIYWSIDRIENGIAVCISDNDKVKNIPVNEFGFAVREGMILYLDGGLLRHDEAEEKKRREYAKTFADSLFKRKQ